jgi:hypothetical protein
VALKRLEPCAGKLARTVLRRVVAGNSHGLSDNSPIGATGVPTKRYAPIIPPRWIAKDIERELSM